MTVLELTVSETYVARKFSYNATAMLFNVNPVAFQNKLH